MLRHWLDRLTFDRWIGTTDGRPTLWSRCLFERRGRRVVLHRMVATDDVDCFHTHPAKALRIVLAGGYVEQHEAGHFVAWLPGMFGIVRPEMSHRIARLIDGVSYSLWIRAPKSAAIELRGSGWKRGSET